MPDAQKIEKTALFFLVGLLFFIWPIPHTITLRYFALVGALLLLVRLFVRGDCPLGLISREMRVPILIYVALMLWLAAGAFLISSDPWMTLDELRGQFFTASFAAVIGLSALFAVSDGFLSQRNLLRLIFWSLVIHVLCVDIAGLSELYGNIGLGRKLLALTSGPINVSGLTPGPDKASFLSAFLFSMIVVEAITRLMSRRQYLPERNVTLVVVFLLLVLSVFFEGARNIGEIMVILVVGFLVIMRFDRKGNEKRFFYAASMLAVFLAVFAVGIFALDDRWSTLSETTSIAWDTENNKAWIDRNKYPYPMLADGRRVNPSNYERLAYIKEGLVLVAERPLGLGYSRDAFGRGLIEKYGFGGGSHSHSGLLDLAIGGGLPAAILWLLFLLSVTIVAYRRFAKTRSYFAMQLFFLTSAFGARMVIDSVIRDHMLQQFLFLAGLFSVMMIVEKRFQFKVISSERTLPEGLGLREEGQVK